MKIYAVQHYFFKIKQQQNTGSLMYFTLFVSFYFDLNTNTSGDLTKCITYRKVSDGNHTNY